MPDCFRCRYRKRTNRTSCNLVVGLGTLFDGGDRIIERIAVGNPNTLSITEDDANPAEWTQPSGLIIDGAITAFVSGDSFHTAPNYRAIIVAVLFLILMAYPLGWELRPNDNTPNQN